MNSVRYAAPGFQHMNQITVLSIYSARTTPADMWMDDSAKTRKNLFLLNDPCDIVGFIPFHPVVIAFSFPADDKMELPVIIGCF